MKHRQGEIKIKKVLFMYFKLCVFPKKSVLENVTAVVLNQDQENLYICFMYRKAINNRHIDYKHNNSYLYTTIFFICLSMMKV